MTGVQTCALPICQALRQAAAPLQRSEAAENSGVEPIQPSPFNDELSQLEWPNESEWNNDEPEDDSWNEEDRKSVV